MYPEAEMVAMMKMGEEGEDFLGHSRSVYLPLYAYPFTLWRNC